MRKIPLLSIALIALAAASCARQQQSYVIDPATGQPVPVVAQQAYAGPQFAQQTSDGGERGLFGSRGTRNRNTRKRNTRKARSGSANADCSIAR